MTHNSENIDKEISKFKRFTGIKKLYNKCSPGSLGGFAFHTFVRSTLFSEIILNSLRIIRRELTDKEWNKNLRILAEGFFCKLLDGDGSIEIFNKKRKTPQVRLKIYDGNLDYLNDYATIMKKFGLTPNVRGKDIVVRSCLNLNSAKMILDMGAFKNSLNKERILSVFNLENKIPTRQADSLD